MQKHDNKISSSPKTNGFSSRKRQYSSGDRGYETGSKKIKFNGFEIPKNPLMENSVSSNNDLKVQSSNHQKPVTYTTEEKVRAAAFALVYGNCKISRDKFGAYFHKTAPDFQTIFGWSRQLLAKGCLNDSHLQPQTKDSKNSESNTNFETTLKLYKPAKLPEKSVKLLPNPDEIPIDSESDGDVQFVSANKVKFPVRERSLSVETLVIDKAEKAGCSEGGRSLVKSDTRSSQRRSRSRSGSRSRSRSRSGSRSRSEDTSHRVSSSDSEIEQRKLTKIIAPLPPGKPKNKKKPADTDSDSDTCYSEETDFLSRRYRKNRKPKPKVNNKCVPELPKAPPSVPNKIQEVQPKGYCTMPQAVSPLVTGQIYTNNLRNMAVKPRDRGHRAPDTDGYGSEYVPTSLGSNKNNYQAFKNNVMKKGFWAKGNGKSLGNKVEILSDKPINNKELQTILQKNANTANKVPYGYVSTNIPLNNGNAGAPVHSFPVVMEPVIRKQQNFTTENVNNFVTTKQYTTSDPRLTRTVQTAKVPEKSSNQLDIKVNNNIKNNNMVGTNNTVKAVTPESNSRIFDIVQSSVTNKSILDIFGDNEQDQNSNNSESMVQQTVAKTHETEWDEDDDALYKTDDPDITDTVLNRSLTEDMATPVSEPQANAPKVINFDVAIARQRRNELLDILNNANQIRNMENNTSTPKHQTPDKSPEKKNRSSKSHHGSKNRHNVTDNRLPDIPNSISHEIAQMATSPRHSIDKSQERVEPSTPTKTNHIPGLGATPPNKDREMHQLKQQNTPPKPDKVPTPTTVTAAPLQNSQALQQLELSNLLSGINTNTLLLAIQNLQQLVQQPPTANANTNNNNSTDQNNESDAQEDDDSNEVEVVETINLTNDEEWEKESEEGDIERQLKQMDGNTGDTPFLSDIFDPSPVVMPKSLTNKLHINLKTSEPSTEASAPQPNENAPVIGNFKSFALPKPIMLNRLKLNAKAQNNKSGKIKRKKLKVCISSFAWSRTVHLLLNLFVRSEPGSEGVSVVAGRGAGGRGGGGGGRGRGVGRRGGPVQVRPLRQ